MIEPGKKKILFFSNTDWYLYNYRLSLARFMRNEGYTVVLMSPRGRYSQDLIKEGFTWINLPLSRRGVFPLQELASLWFILFHYLREKPTLVHHFTIKPVLYGSLAAKFVGVPHVVNSITGLGYLFLSQERMMRIARVVIKPFYRFALAGSKVIFENEWDREKFIRMKLVENIQTNLIPGVGVDLERYSYIPEPDGIPNVILASRLLWDKGVREFVQSASALKEKGIQAKFILVGAPDPGNPSTIPVESIQKWVQEGIVEWWGHRDDMPLVLSKSHIVTLPSYSEGMPTILLEASASGRPILATDIPGCRDIVQDGKNGYLVPLGDQNALETALERLILDGALRKTMGEYSRAYAEANFDQNTMNQLTLTVYQNFLEKFGSSETPSG